MVDPSLFSLSPAQERYWWTARLAPHGRMHALPLGLRLRGSFDRAALDRALLRLVSSQDALRVRVVERGGAPCQQRIEGPCPQVRFVDLSGDTPAAAEQRMRDDLRAQLHTRYDLSGSLWALTLFALPGDEHCLYLQCHHIISDAQSLGLFFRQLSAFYVAEIGSAPPLDLRCVSFVERADERNQSYMRAPLAAEEDYWRAHLTGAPPFLELPTERPRPLTPSYEGGARRRRLGHAAVQQLRRVAAEHDLTLYMVLLGAFAAVLHRFTAQDDVVIGTMMSGRADAPEAETIGCFAGPTPLRLRLHPRSRASWSAFFQEVRQVVLGGMQHAGAPFQRLVEWLAPPRELGRTPLFSIFFVFQNTLGDFQNLFGCESRLCEYEELRASAEYDLFLQARETGGEIDVLFQYAVDVVSDELVESIDYAFTRALDAIVASFEEDIDAVDVVAPEQRQLQLVTWNETQREYPQTPAHELFEAAASRDLAAPAASFEGKSLSYGELNERANRIAHHLIALGVEREDRVGICMERSVDLLAVMLGIQKAGGAYLPLDPTYPTDRLAALCAQAQLTLAVTDAGSRQRLPEGVRAITCDEASDQPTHNPALKVAPDQAAYVLFTSGSTGVPKGVTIEHGALSNLLFWARECFGPEAFASVLSPSSLSFDSSVFEIYAPLAWGGRVVLARNLLSLPHLSPDEDVRMLVTGAPSVLAEILREHGIPRSIKTVCVAGEALPLDLVHALYAVPPVEAVYNLYGLTEATVYSSFARIGRDVTTAPTIGRPLANTRLYVLEERLRPVPIGVTGEICIGGAGLGRGFITDLPGVAGRFTSDPFVPGERIYRTGDYGAFTADGNLRFLGRRDHQVKIRGFRVEAVEIELAMRSHAGVKSCVVVARAPRGGRALHLVAYFERANPDTTVAELRAYLRTRLPDQMIPSLFVPLDHLPLNSNGKVDRGALPEPTWEEPSRSSSGFKGPWERLVAESWSKVLPGHKAGPEASFFECGGHSLLIPRLQRDLSDRSGVTLNVTDFFAYPSIRSMAAHLERTAPAPVVAAPPPRSKESAATTPTDSRTLAIVGAACRFPGARTPEEFFKLIAGGRSAIGRAPKRSAWRALPGVPGLEHGAFLDGIDLFDPSFFRLSLHEARRMDPQQRLLLEVAWEACERAGYSPRELGQKRIGVFVGASFNDYPRLLDAAGAGLDPHVGAGNALSMLANRVSYLLGLRGPSLTVDTACSSSLVALHLAAQSLAVGDADMALVGGVALMVTPHNAIIWGRNGMLSPDGRCKTFDAGANGYVPGEGVVALLVKPLARALGDGDRILALVRGTAVNHDGGAKIGLTAPSPAGQRDAILASWKAAGIDPQTLSYIEAHGTGTPLGDPIEVRALCEAFGHHTRSRAFCALGSVKTLIGHTGPAAGLAGVLSAALSLEHQTIPMSRNFVSPNPAIDFERTPFYVNDQPRPWAAGGTARRAGVSAFGFGGANAHLVLEEAPPVAPSPRAAEPRLHLLPLSARSEASLRALAEAYVELFSRGLVDMDAVCFTASVGRQHHAHRLAVLARTPNEAAQTLRGLTGRPAASDHETGVLLSTLPGGGAAHEEVTAPLPGALGDILRACLEGESSGAGAPGWALLEGLAPSDRAAVLRSLASAYVHGETIDWRVAATSSTARRALLPTYPFERISCWPDDFAGAADGAGEPLAAPPAEGASPARPAPPAQWLHGSSWRAAREGVFCGITSADDFLVLADSAGVASRLAAELTARGAEVAVVPSGSSVRGAGGDDEGLMARVDAWLRRPDRRALRVLDLSSLSPSIPERGGGALAAAARSRAQRLCRLLLALSGSAVDVELRVVVDGTAREASAASMSPADALTAGLLRAFGREAPRVHAQLISVAVGAEDRDRYSDRLIQELQLRADEPEVSLRESERLAPAVTSTLPGRGEPSPLAIPDGAVCLITGGLGGIGRALALHLAATRRAKLILVSRHLHARMEDTATLVAAVRGHGGDVEIFAADVSDADRMSQVIREGERGVGPIAMAFHLAGVAPKGRLAAPSPATFDDVLRPKVDGACVLDELLDRRVPMVLFSSLAGWEGNPFQVVYSAANRFLDAFAHACRGRGRSAVSIDWCGWRGAGMGAALAGAAEGIEPSFGMAVLDQALLLGAPQVLVMRPDEVAAGAPIDAGPPRPSFNANALLREIIGRALDVDADRIDATAPLIDLGVDSILAVRIVQQIEARIGLKLPRTAIFDYPTVERLAAEVARRSSTLSTESGARAVERPESATIDGIAIIGLAGRFPGSPDPETFFDGLCQGKDFVTERSILDAAGKGHSIPIRAGFLDDRAGFDAALFRISPREAEQMDPQQRVLLEVAWEALERAGYAGGQLTGSKAGVFIGASANPVSDRASIDTNEYTLTGRSTAILSNRVSYAFDLRGPSISVDTLCSSSLVALHLAVESLRRSECDVALVGGVRVGISAAYHLAAEKMRAISPSGRCATFDESADGMISGEGAAVVVLKPLARALADHDHVLAVIRGSAVNHTGRGAGMMAPRADAQHDVVRQALAAARVTADTIEYVEAHGTGTALGDPIEVSALQRAFASDTARRQFCALGSVKTNVGHLEPAAGMAGLVKVVFALQRGIIPPSLHLRGPNPEMKLEATPFYLVDECRQWPSPPSTGKRRAGLSAFGIGGVNAHVILEQPPTPTARRDAARERPLALALSARGRASLSALAARVLAHAEQHPELRAEDVCHTLSTGRAKLSHRVAVVAKSRPDLLDQLRRKLEALPNGEADPNLKIGFVFTGQGAQYPRMSLGLFEQEPVFRETLERCSTAMRGELGASILDLLRGDDPDLLRRTANAQPLTFAVQLALTALLHSWNVLPHAVCGHSVGEIAALTLAGALSLEEAARFVVRRGALMQSLPPGGGMIAVLASESEIASLLDGHRGSVALAAVNGPSNTVLAGPQSELDSLSAKLTASGVRVVTLEVSHAFHSPWMDPALDGIERIASELSPQRVSLPIALNLDGNLVPRGEKAPIGARYFRRHVREPVRFGACIEALVREGCTLFLEIGPHPALVPLGRAIAPTAEWVPTLSRGTEDTLALFRAAARAFELGAPVAWGALSADSARRVPLPTYPFERELVPSTRTETRAAAPTLSSAPPVERPSSQSDGPLPVRSAPPREDERKAHPLADRLPPARAVPTDHLAIVRRTVAAALESREEVVGVDVALVELGADSLVLTRVISQLDRWFGVRPSSRSLFDELNTVRRIADYIAARAPAQTTVIDEPRPADPLPARGVAAPATANQRPKAAARPAQTALDPRQREHLQDLSRRYVARTKRSRDAANRSRHFLADTRRSANFRMSTKEMGYPIIGDRAEGSRLWDIDGNEYVDVSMGFGVHLFGHRPSFITAALEEAVRQGPFLGPQAKLAEEVARLTLEMIGMDRLLFCNTGTEAIMTALRLARTATGRRKIVLFDGSYHGFYDGTLAAPGQDSSGAMSAIPTSLGLSPGLFDDIVVLPYGDEASLDLLVREGADIAAVLVEPVRSRHPHVQPAKFLRAVRALTQETGTMLILDEVITGFRCGADGAQGVFGVKGDLAVYGKILGGGMPIGVVAGAATCLNAVDGGPWGYGDSSFPSADRAFFAGTFCKHPLSLAASRAVLLEIARAGGDLYKDLNAKTEGLCAKLDEVFARRGAPIHTIRFTSLFRLASDQPLDPLYLHLNEKGVYVWEGRNLFLSTAHDQRDVDFIVDAVTRSILELQENGFFLPPADLVALPGRERPATVAATVAADPPVLPPEQQELWLATQSGSAAAAAYMESVIFRLEGDLHVPSLALALSEVVRRHESLRAAFGASTGELRIGPPYDVALACDELPPSANADDVRAWIDAKCAPGVDVSTGRPVRCHLLRVDPHEHLLTISAPHLIADGASMSVVLRDMARAYSALRRGEPVALGEAASLVDFVRSRNSRLSSPEGRASIAYWIDRLKGATPLLLPQARPRPRVKSFVGDRCRLELPSGTARRMRAFAAERGASVFHVALAAAHALVYRLSNQGDFVMGVSTMPATAHDRPLVATAVVMLPLRVRADAESTFAEHLERVRDAVQEGLEHDVMPVADVVRGARLPRDASRAPLFDVAFNMERSEPAPELEGLRATCIGYQTPMDALVLGRGIGPIEIGARTAKFDLGFVVEVTGERATLVFEYNSAIFDRDTVQRFARGFDALLATAMARPESPLGELPSTPPVESLATAPSLGASPEQRATDAPRNEVEARLVALWEKILDVRPIGVKDDFFRLGGHSLTAVRLLGALRKDFGLDLRMALFVRLSTIERLHELIDLGQRDRGADETLLCLQQGNGGVPFVCVHPAGGGALCYARLARALGEGRPFFGIEARGLSSNADPREDIPSMAAAYLDAIRHRFGDRPFLLGGWSMGGLIAYEMAQQMAISGQPLEELMLFDTDAEAEPVDPDRDMFMFLQGLGVRDTPTGPFSGSQDERLAAAKALAVRRGVWSETEDGAVFERLFRVFEANLRATRAYTPEPYDGRVVLVRAEKTAPGEDGALGWRELVSDIDVDVAAGDHFSMMDEPFVRDLAARLCRRIDEAGADPKHGRSAE
jgi:amino acid adenylation domain-containing protein